MRTRNGKVARLPRAIREELNRRLDEGELGKGLVEWLNRLPETQNVVTAEFGSRPISEQNLSEWKAGGFRDWQRQQERRALVRELADDAQELKEDSAGLEAGDQLSAVLVAELTETAQTLLATIADPAERWARLQELLRELARVRREDHHAGRLQIERERRAVERAEEERREAFRREHAPYERLLVRWELGALFGQPDFCSQLLALGAAESLFQHSATLPDHGGSCPPGFPNQTQSS